MLSWPQGTYVEANIVFDWSNLLVHGIKDLLRKDNLDRLSVDGSAFSPTMKKKVLVCITKMIHFYQEAEMGVEKTLSF